VTDQNHFNFDDDFDLLLEHLPELASDQQKAMARYKEHLWALVLICERRLKSIGITDDKAYKTSCALIAEIAHYQGGECRYLPRGDKLKQELRDIHMFRLWHNDNWTVDKIHKEYCPQLNQIQVYKILRTKREEYRNKIQPKLI
jgi:Mor family transcriptional regulator